MLIDKIFITHHPALTKRKQNLLLDLQREGIANAEWVEMFPPEEIKTTGKIGISKKEASLYLKHRYCLEQQLKNGWENILILEDDAMLPENFIPYLEKCLDEFSELRGDMLFLGGGSKEFTLNNFFFRNNKGELERRHIDIEKKLGQLVYYHPDFLTRCTHAYIINIKAVKKILMQLDDINRPIDNKLNEIIEKENLKVCWAEPPILQKTVEGLEKTSLRDWNQLLKLAIKLSKKIKLHWLGKKIYQKIKASKWRRTGKLIKK